MTKTNYPATLLCDFYKVSHMAQYPEGTEVIYSTWTPRSNRYFPNADKVVAFGIQSFIKKYLINYFDENFFKRPVKDVVEEYKRVLKYTLNVENPDATHIEKLHKEGRLPIKIKAVKEGSLVPIKVPMLTIENTKPEFFWVTNYLETLISNEIWLPMTSATIAHTYRQILDKYAMKTTGTTDGVEFQAHDFSMRGMGAFDASAASGAAHLLSFVGTDTIPAIMYHEEYYNANIENELVGTSIPATEHSVMCSYGETNELDLFKHLINEVYPNGFFSVVSDTWDFWKVVGEYLPTLKDDILKRDGRVVIRPDSGDPIEILCGTIPYKYVSSIEEGYDFMLQNVLKWRKDGIDLGDYPQKVGISLNGEETVYKISHKLWEPTMVEFSEYIRSKGANAPSYLEGIVTEKTTISLEEKGLIQSLWDIFGGTVTEQEYKVLDSHIGAIYGDSITIERCEEICRRLEAKGFASTNVVFGVGSFTYQYNTRDTFGFAMKATYAVVNGEERMLFKDPKTDDGTKKSQRGLVAVIENGYFDELEHIDGLNKESYEIYENADRLETVFEDGKLVRDQTLQEIRFILNNN